MSKSKKTLAWLVVAILAIPALAIFNDDETNFYLNFFGLAYAYFIVKLAPHILPMWMVEYLTPKDN